MNIPSLTGIRGAAALWVLLYHVQGFAMRLHMPALHNLPIAVYGWQGVDLFFVLSGFVLMLVHERDFATLTAKPLARFFWLRVFRIYPLATVVLLLIAALAALDTPFAQYVAHGAVPPNFTRSAFIRTLTLSTRWWAPYDGDWNQPVWSLSAELLGYCFFPLVAFFAARVANLRVLVLLAIACLIYPTAVAWARGNAFADDIFWGAGSRMAGAFTAGIVLCRLHRLTPPGARAMQARSADIALVVLVVAQLIPAGILVSTLCFGAIVYGIASGEGVANRIFAAPVAMFLGRISFPLYLVHVTVLTWLAFNLGRYAAPAWAPEVGLALSLVFCFSLAWLLHLGVEKPAHDLARRNLPFGPRREHAPVEVLAREATNR